MASGTGSLSIRTAAGPSAGPATPCVASCEWTTAVRSTSIGRASYSIRRPIGGTERGASLLRAALIIALAGVVACGRAATGEPLPTPVRSDAPIVASMSPPLSSPRPTDAPAASAAPPTPLPGEAYLVVQVIDASTLAPIRDATVRLEPFQQEARTDASGTTEFPHLPVPGRCRWLTIVVTAPGYGRLEVIDSPLYPQHRATFDARLTHSDQRSILGPPTGASEGWNLCSL